MKSKKLEPIVDELVNDVRLLWVRPKVTERIVLVFHGVLCDHLWGQNSRC